MPKHGFLTPKAIANRIKSKGLQKLRWYCQMCQKQCRDENGFKCHSSSESHQRQLLLFAENPDKYIDQFSQEFLDDFMQLLKRRFGTKRVHANQVYQEYIADRNHLHMNATQWETLTDLVKWLGREGHCTVDETEKGWFVSYIDRDPDTIRRQEELAKQDKMKLDDEERMAKLFQRQMERDRTQSKPRPDPVFTELKKTDEDEKITFAVRAVDRGKKPPMDQNPLAAQRMDNPNKRPEEKTLSAQSIDSPNKRPEDKKRKPALEEIMEQEKANQRMDNPNKRPEEKKRKMALEEIMDQEKAVREKKSRKDHWLAPGIVVKAISKKLGEGFYKKKVVVTDVQDSYYAVIQAADSGEKTVAHQKQLETVIPNVGRKVLILNGAYRGCEATLLGVSYETFSVRVKICGGSFKGKVLDSVRYEDVSKMQDQT